MEQPAEDMYWLGSQLSGRSLFFTSVITVLFYLDFTPSSFSSSWDPIWERNPGGPVSRVHKVGRIQPFEVLLQDPHILY